jgi:alkylhydroperoxidase family enzyme
MRVDVPESYAGDPRHYIAATYSPLITAAGTAFSLATYEHSRLPLRVFEAARIRTAHINGCVGCQTWRTGRDANAFVKSMSGSDENVVTRSADMPDEAFYDAVHEWRTSPLFTDAERLAIEFADGFGLDPQGLSANEDLWRRIRAAFSDDEIVDLTYCLACWAGLGRAKRVLSIDNFCEVASAPPKTQSA